MCIRDRVEPGDGSFNDPAPGKHREPFGMVRSFDYFNGRRGQNFSHGFLKNRTLVATIGIKFPDEWKQAKQRCHQHGTAIAILDVRAVNDGVQHQAGRIDQDMPLLAFDFLPRIITMRIDAGPPFSALFTL